MHKNKLTISIDSILLRCLSEIHREHDDLGRHGRHLVAEAVGEDPIHVRREGEPAVALSLLLVHHFAIGTYQLYVDVQEAAFHNLKCQACETKIASWKKN